MPGGGFAKDIAAFSVTAPSRFLFIKITFPFFHMPFDRRETLMAQHMFDLAGILYSRLFVHTQQYQPVGKQHVPLIHGLSDVPPAIGQRDKAA